MNQAEQWFSIVTTKRIRRGTFRSESGLGPALYAYINNWNDTAGPSPWTATPEEILAKIARTRLSIGASVRATIAC